MSTEVNEKEGQKHERGLKIVMVAATSDVLMNRFGWCTDDGGGTIVEALGIQWRKKETRI